MKDTFGKFRDLGVGAVVENNGKFLVVKESYERKEIDKLIDMYSFPTGHVYETETMYSAAERETFEETGYKVKVLSIIGFYDFSKAFGIAYRAELVDNNQQEYNKDEIKEVLWLTPEEIMAKTLRPAVKEILHDYLNSKSYPLDIITNINL